ncbi:carbohydrate ABC transporter permease, partial [Candidatus Aerophobetes bacterium]|nr:carbohydrate ABC transporter permease [Candidatus Aerophobetes bacterium]
MLKKIRKSKKTEKVIEGMLFIVAAIIALMFLFPMVYTVISSLKPLEDITSVPMRWIPREIRLRNFIEPFIEKNFGIYFFNSTFVTVTVTFSSLFFCSLAGYSLTKFDYKGKNFFFILVLMTMMVPIEITIV